MIKMTGRLQTEPAGTEDSDFDNRKLSHQRLLALSPIPLSTFAGESTQNVGRSFIKSYCGVLMEGTVIVLACIIFSLFASSPPVIDTTAQAVNQVWAYIGELIFNMLVLVGTVKMSDRIVREMMGL